MKRRDLLVAVGGGLLLGSSLSSAAASRVSRERWISAHGGESGEFGVGWLTGGELGGTTSVGFRGHAVLQHPSRPDSAVFLPRRPGKVALEVDLLAGEVRHRFTAAEDRHFYGHGCFSVDGTVLYTTESHVSVGTGLVTVRDANTYERLEEWSSHGIGPHDLAALPDGKTLVVANGGILTRPETGRRALNLPTMRSSLCYLDAGTGLLLDEFFVAEPKASIRHLDVARDGTVAFAIQLQRDASGHDRLVPLVGVHRPGAALELFEKPAAILHQLRDYVGSVAICDQGRVAGFASPRGNLVVFYHVDSGALLGYHQLRDVCGLAVSREREAFVLSNSFGEIRELDWISLHERKHQRLRLPDFRWDNHLLVASLG
ncbi:MAG: DUF1513 domain-containing protein [Pseudomonadota bacterium]